MAPAWARWQLGLALNQAGAWLPWGTLAANLAGGLLAGLAAGWLQAAPSVDPVWRLALFTGFLGALTTFSAFSLEVVEMLLAQRWWSAVMTVLLHTGGTLLMTWAGLRLATGAARLV
ncbi:MAG: CrcB family protein [Comamonadaceae bacterium]|nr:CrcB family protein [Comamonadaceae bacterium]